MWSTSTFRSKFFSTRTSIQKSKLLMELIRSYFGINAQSSGISRKLFFSFLVRGRGMKMPVAVLCKEILEIPFQMFQIFERWNTHVFPSSSNPSPFPLRTSIKVLEILKGTNAVTLHFFFFLQYLGK